MRVFKELELQAQVIDLKEQLAASEAREKNYREEVVKLSYDLANAYSEREAAVQSQADLTEQLAKEWQLHDETKRQLSAKDARIAEWEKAAKTWIESPEAGKQLDGYREMGRQLAAKDAEIAEKDALLELASEALGRFCSDEGWGQEDMDTMDSIDAHLVRSRR